MNRKATVSLAVALLGSASALAQSSSTSTYNPSWYVSPSLNLMDPGAAFDGYGNGHGVGLRFGKPTSQNWDIQLGPTYARSNRNGSRYEQTTLGVDGLYLFSRERLRPFLLMGAGVERDKLSGTGNASRTSPFIEAGGGLQYSFSDQWSMQVDLRRVHGFLRDSNTFGSNHSDNNYLTVGLTYTFDKPRQEIAVARRPEPEMRPVAPPPRVEPAPAPTPVPAPAPAPRFERVTLSATELFEFDKAVLRQPQPKLDEIAQVLNRNTQVNNINVVGYTDRLGSESYNRKLSQRRADAVKDYLVAKGVASSRLGAEGRGEANPVVSCTDKKRAALIACLAPNRRVEVEQIVVERRLN